MTDEDKEAMFALLYGRFIELYSEIEAIKSVLTDEQRARINKLKPEKSSEIHNNGQLKIYLSYLKEANI